MPERLRKLLGEATPRPWDDDPLEMQADGSVLWDVEAPDYALIVALVNCADELLAVAEAARKYRQAVETRHLTMTECAHLDDALAALDRKQP